MQYLGHVEGGEHKDTVHIITVNLDTSASAKFKEIWS